MRKVIALYTKKEKLQLLNQSLSQIVVNAVNNIVNKDKENYSNNMKEIFKIKKIIRRTVLVLSNQ